MEKYEVTIKQLQDFFGISRTTIWEYVKEGMPHQKKGRYLSFDFHEVKKWIKARKEGVGIVYDAREIHGNDIIAQIEYIKERVDGKKYLQAIFNILTDVFRNEPARIGREYSISGRAIWLLSSQCAAMLAGSANYSAAAMLLEESLLEIAAEVMREKYKTVQIATFFGDWEETTVNFENRREIEEIEECEGFFRNMVTFHFMPGGLKI